MKKTGNRVKDNNAHLIPKSNLVMQAFNLECEMIYHKPIMKRLPV